MGCIIALLALITPRIVMVVIWLTTDWFSRAYETTIWPLLGFFFLPYATLAYMAAMFHNGGRVSGLWILLIIVAVIADLSSDGEASRSGVKKRKGAKGEPGD